MRAARALAPALAALVFAACGTTNQQSGPSGLQPVNGRSGLRLSGTVHGRQFSTSAGAPNLVAGDCDPNDGRDQDVCFQTQDIDGLDVVLVFENPDVLVAGDTIPVNDPGCPPELCDAVSDVAVVDLQIGVGGDRTRASDGTLQLTAVVPRLRYAGEILLRFPDGSTAAGEFEVVPRPE